MAGTSSDASCDEYSVVRAGLGDRSPASSGSSACCWRRARRATSAATISRSTSSPTSRGARCCACAPTSSGRHGAGGWGAPRIHGELLKLGIKVSQATVGRWMPWRPKVPSPTWRSFLHNHLPEIAAIDMFVVATATCRLLYALIVLNLDRRQVVHFEVTQNPTQDWLSRQMTEAFPWDTAPRYLLRDRDKSYGLAFRHRLRAMGITEIVTAPRSPWQNPYAERLIGSIRRECLDHMIILNERHL